MGGPKTFLGRVFSPNLRYVFHPPEFSTPLGRSLRVSPKTGVSRGCPAGCPWGVFGPRAPECSKSVPRVSGTLFGHSGHTLGIVFGHSRARGPKGFRDTSWDTLLDTPVFGDTLGDTPRDTFGPKGPKDSCRGPGASKLHARKIPRFRGYLGFLRCEVPIMFLWVQG